VGSGRDLSLGFLRETPLVLNAQDLAGDARRELDRKAAHLVAELLPHPLVIRLRGLASLGDDLLGLRDRLAGFLLLHAGRGGPGLLDQLAGLDTGLLEEIAAGGLGLRKLLLDLLGVREALGDALPAL